MGQHEYQRISPRIWSTCLLIGILSIAWSLAAHPLSGSDPTFHLSSIWCGQGIQEGQCEQGSDEFTRMVPKALLTQCPLSGYVGTCSKVSFTDSVVGQEIMEETSFVNVRGSYTNGFYWVSSLFVVKSVSLSIIMMRLVNVFFFLLLFALAWSVASDLLRRVFSVVFSLSIPTIMWLVMPVSNQSWAISGLLVFWVFVLALGQPKLLSVKHRVFASAGAVLSVVLVFLSRVDAVGLLALEGAACAVILLSWRGYSLWQILTAVSTIGLLGFLILRYVLSPAFFTYFTELTQGEYKTLSKYDFDLVDLLFHNVHHSSEFVFESIAGRHETVGDPIATGPTIYLLVLALGGLAVFLSGKPSRMFALVSGIVGSAFFLYPVLATTRNGQTFIQEFIPRYLAPFAIPGIGLLIYTSPGVERLRSVSSSVRRILVFLVGFAHASALHIALRSATTADNLGISTWNLNDWVLWWWSIGPSPMTVWILGSLALPIFLSLELKRPINA